MWLPCAQLDDAMPLWIFICAVAVYGGEVILVLTAVWASIRGEIQLEFPDHFMSFLLHLYYKLRGSTREYELVLQFFVLPNKSQNNRIYRNRPTSYEEACLSLDDSQFTVAPLDVRWCRKKVFSNRTTLDIRNAHYTFCSLKKKPARCCFISWTEIVKEWTLWMRIATSFTTTGFDCEYFTYEIVAWKAYKVNQNQRSLLS